METSNVKALKVESIAEKYLAWEIALPAPFTAVCEVVKLACVALVALKVFGVI